MEQQPNGTFRDIPVQQIKLAALHLNKGQIKDVPKNPRFIKDARYEALKRSVKDDPEMLELRELVAYDNNGELVIIMGNMRFRAMKELGFKQAPVKVLPTATPAKKLRAYIQKDNIAFGSNDWDAIANEWDVAELEEFGLECDFLDDLDDGGITESLEEKDGGGIFSVTFQFSKDNKEAVNAYVEEIGKDNIAKMITRLALERG